MLMQFYPVDDRYLYIMTDPHKNSKDNSEYITEQLNFLCNNNKTFEENIKNSPLKEYKYYLSETELTKSEELIKLGFPLYEAKRIFEESIKQELTDEQESKYNNLEKPLNWHRVTNLDNLLIDEEIAPLIEALWQNGIPTFYSCQGGYTDFASMEDKIDEMAPTSEDDIWYYNDKDANLVKAYRFIIIYEKDLQNTMFFLPDNFSIEKGTGGYVIDDFPNNSYIDPTLPSVYPIPDPLEKYLYIYWKPEA